MGCTKIKYDTKELADEDLKNIVENNDYRNWKRVSPKRSYYCKYCEKFHLTSKVKIFDY